MVSNNIFPKNEINFYLDNKHIMINIYSHVTDTKSTYKPMKIFENMQRLSTTSTYS